MESSDVNFLVKVILNNGLDISAGSLNISGLTASRLVATDGSKNLTSSITSLNLKDSVTDETGSGSLVFNTNPSFTTGITVSGYGNFTGITASSGTFTNTGDYSIKTSSGMNISAGTINLNNSAMIKNSLNPVDTQDVATKYYVDNLFGGGGTEPSAWIITGNNAGSGRVLGTTNPQSFNIISNNIPRITIGDTGIITLLSNTLHTIFVNGITASSGTFTKTGDYSIITSSGIKINSPGIIQIGGLAASRLVATDGSKNLTSSITSANLALSVTDETGTAGNLVFSNAPTLSNITVSGWGNFSSGITASSGTFTNTGDYSIITSSGIQIKSQGTLQISKYTTAGFVKNDGSGNLSGGNTISAGDIPSSNLVVGTGISLTGTLSNRLVGSGSNVTISLNLSNPNSWSATQTFSKGINTSTITVSNFTTAGFIKNNTSGVLSGGNTIVDSDIPSTIVRTSRSINTTSPLSGGGNLSADRTLSVGGLSSMGTGNYVVGVNNLASVWEYKNIVGVTNEIDITHSAGQIQIGLVNPLSVAKGGTGLSSAGGSSNKVLLTADGSTFSVGTISNNYLSVGSYTNITGVGTLTAGTWNANLIGLAYGGTNKNLTPANGGVVWTDSDSMEVTSAGTAGQVLLSGGAASPTWGTLGLNYGGTGANLSGASNLPIKKSGTYLTAAAIDLSGSEVSNTLPVLKGGTGNTSFTTSQPVIYDGSKLISYNGFNGSFTVVTSTTPPQSCMQLTYQYGILASTATVNCP